MLCAVAERGRRKGAVLIVVDDVQDYGALKAMLPSEVMGDGVSGAADDADGDIAGGSAVGAEGADARSGAGAADRVWQVKRGWRRSGRRLRRCASGSGDCLWALSWWDGICSSGLSCR